jgi:hypothetical protein
MSGSSSAQRAPFGEIALASAILAIVATFLPWIHFLETERGLDRTEGLIVLVAAFNGALAAALAVARRIGRRSFALWAFGSGIAMLGAIGFMRVTAIGERDLGYPALCFGDDCYWRVDAGLNLAAFAAAA